MWINLLKYTTSYTTGNIFSSVVSVKLKMVRLVIVVPLWRQVSFGIFSHIQSSCMYQELSCLGNCCCDAKTCSSLLKLWYLSGWKSNMCITTIEKPYYCTWYSKKLCLYHLGQFFCLFVLLEVMKKLNYFFLSLYCLKGRETSTAESI